VREENRKEKIKGEWAGAGPTIGKGRGRGSWLAGHTRERKIGKRKERTGTTLRKRPKKVVGN
jgi:hypothetical protein